MITVMIGERNFSSSVVISHHQGLLISKIHKCLQTPRIHSAQDRCEAEGVASTLKPNQWEHDLNNNTCSLKLHLCLRKMSSSFYSFCNDEENAFKVC